VNSTCIYLWTFILALNRLDCHIWDTVCVSSSVGSPETVMNIISVCPVLVACSIDSGSSGFKFDISILGGSFFHGGNSSSSNSSSSASWNETMKYLPNLVWKSSYIFQNSYKILLSCGTSNCWNGVYPPGIWMMSKQKWTNSLPPIGQITSPCRHHCNHVCLSFSTFLHHCITQNKREN